LAARASLGKVEAAARQPLEFGQPCPGS